MLKRLTLSKVGKVQFSCLGFTNAEHAPKIVSGQSKHVEALLAFSPPSVSMAEPQIMSKSEVEQER